MGAEWMERVHVGEVNVDGRTTLNWDFEECGLSGYRDLFNLNMCGSFPFLRNGIYVSSE
jgi:hypothetical protein